MARVLISQMELFQINGANCKHITDAVSAKMLLDAKEFYLVHNGKRLSADDDAALYGDVHCVLKVVGGKGGFGSMLRAIGAQIEKTTNREACRDLSGRRLRDINEEKRLKAWLEKQSEREREAEERKKRKIEKLLAVPKHEFKDAEYEEARAKLTEKVNDAVEEGFKKTQHAQKLDDKDERPKTLKRKSVAASGAVQSKKKKPALWIGDDISSTDESDGNSSDEASEDDVKTKHTGMEKTTSVISNPAITDVTKNQSGSEPNNGDQEKDMDSRISSGNEATNSSNCIKDNGEKEDQA